MASSDLMRLRTVKTAIGRKLVLKGLKPPAAIRYRGRQA